MPRIERFADPKHAEYWLAAKVGELLKDEGEAIAEYEEALGHLDPEIHKDIIEVFRAITAQEKEHVDKLQQVLKALDKIKTSNTLVNRKVKD